MNNTPHKKQARIPNASDGHGEYIMQMNSTRNLHWRLDCGVSTGLIIGLEQALRHAAYKSYHPCHASGRGRHERQIQSFGFLTEVHTEQQDMCMVPYSTHEQSSLVEARVCQHRQFHTLEPIVERNQQGGICRPRSCRLARSHCRLQCLHIFER